jgi:hypothetical protein
MPLAFLSRASRRLAERFLKAGAFAEDRAIALADVTPAERSRLRRLLENNIAYEAAPGLFWLDRERYRLYLDHRRRLAFLGILIVLIVLFFVVEIAGRA